MFPVVVYVQLCAPVPFVHPVHVFTKHVPVVIVLLLPHTGVFHVAKFVIAVQSVLHDWFPVPLFVFPASHAVHVLLPVAFVYDPATHAV